MTSYRPSVAVLGAGLAGLSAAVQLIDQGCEVTVFEARDRAGGRVWSTTTDTPSGSAVVERGAEFVLHGYDAMRTLLADHALELVETGMSYYVRTVGDVEGVTTSDVVAEGRRALGFVGESVDRAPSAEDVLQRLGEGDLVDALRARIEISTAAEAREVSALSLHSIASMEPRPSWRVSGGNQRLPDAIATRLGDRVRCGHEVIKVEEIEGGVAVTTTPGPQGTFDAVVMALPLAVVRNCVASNMLALPSWKTEALANIVQGHAAKLHLPLLGSPDLSAVMSVHQRFWTWTAFASERRVAPVLNCFMGSASALGTDGNEMLRQRWARAVRKLRPDLTFAPGVEPLLTRWSDDPLAGGAYSARGVGAGPDDVELINRPVGSVFFAGEYADPTFTGLMEGAIRSGQRAASQVVSALAR